MLGRAHLEVGGTGHVERGLIRSSGFELFGAVVTLVAGGASSKPQFGAGCLRHSRVRAGNAVCFGNRSCRCSTSSIPALVSTGCGGNVGQAPCFECWTTGQSDSNGQRKPKQVRRCGPCTSCISAQYSAKQSPPWPRQFSGVPCSSVAHRNRTSWPTPAQIAGMGRRQLAATRLQMFDR